MPECNEDGWLLLTDTEIKKAKAKDKFYKLTDDPLAK
jgi:hypothetical protein